MHHDLVELLVLGVHMLHGLPDHDVLAMLELKDLQKILELWPEAFMPLA